MENLPMVTIKKRDNYTKEFGDGFTLDFMESMGELRDSVKVNENDDANVNITRIKGDLDRERYGGFRSGRMIV